MKNHGMALSPPASLVPSVAAPRRSAGPVNPLGRLALAVAVAEERRRLASLSDAALRDIGVSREEALAEARRGWFDLPRRSAARKSG